MIEGKKVYLQAVEEKSIEQLRQWRNNPVLRQYFREYREINKKMQSEWFNNRVCNNQNQVDFEIRDKETQKLIGHCGLYYIDWINRKAEFTIYIGDFNYRNGGYGSDALRTLIKYGFNNLNLNRIWCEVYSNNKAIDIYRHIGFKDEGILREQYFDAGIYWNSHILGMLKSDFENLDFI
ncbi:GNAT family N-acetyltransferase [Candidatus Pacearchaeota archaeon]|nr:GNAT family N-acetyltransferase [Candidatus Pacearchaeota archaeon]|tara:strand:- start:7447 stop:7983 length:537 start_codon:yes stop_codon:yes gene_type:complete